MRYLELLNYLKFCQICNNDSRKINCSSYPDEFILNKFSFHENEAIFHLSMKDRSIYCDSDNLDIKSGSTDISLSIDYYTDTYKSNFDLGYGYPLSMNYGSYCDHCGSLTYSSDIFFVDGEIRGISIEQDKFILNNNEYTYVISVFPTRIKVSKHSSENNKTVPTYFPIFDMDFSDIQSICNKIDKLLIFS